MKIRLSYIKDIAVIDVEGKININSSKLIEEVGSALDMNMRKIIIDIQKVDFVDYNGLSVLAIAYKSILNRKGRMKLCGLSVHILELLRVVKLDEVFEIYNNLEEALDSFKETHRPRALEALEQPVRRKFMRLDIDIPVHFKLSRGLSHKGESHLYSGRVANLSGAGAFIRTINILPPGSQVAMEIALEKGEQTKPLKGVVMWLADKGLQPDFYPGMGIGFTNLPHRAQEKIIVFVEKNAVHRKGRL